MLVIVTMLSYGVLLRPELAALATPSMAGVLEAVVGRWGAVFISIGLLISVLGNYLSWSLVAAEVLFSAASHKTMPAFLATENKNKAPVASLWASNLLIQAFLLITPFAEYAFKLALKMTSVMTLVPYLLVAAYGWKLASKGETYQTGESARRKDLIFGAIATIYAAGMIYAGGLKFLLLSSMLYALGTALYFWSRREQGLAVFDSKEKLVFGGITIAGLVGVCGFISGALTL